MGYRDQSRQVPDTQTALTGTATVLTGKTLSEILADTEAGDLIQPNGSSDDTSDTAFADAKSRTLGAGQTTLSTDVYQTNKDNNAVQYLGQAGSTNYVWYLDSAPGPRFKPSGFRFNTIAPGGNSGNFAVINCSLVGDGGKFVDRFFPAGHAPIDLQIVAINMDLTTARGIEILGE